MRGQSWTAEAEICLVPFVRCQSRPRQAQSGHSQSPSATAKTHAGFLGPQLAANQGLAPKQDVCRICRALCSKMINYEEFQNGDNKTSNQARGPSEHEMLAPGWVAHPRSCVHGAQPCSGSEVSLLAWTTRFLSENLLVVDQAPSQGRQQNVLFGGPETPVPSGCLGTHTHFTIPPPVTRLGNVF